MPGSRSKTCGFLRSVPAPAAIVDQPLPARLRVAAANPSVDWPLPSRFQRRFPLETQSFPLSVSANGRYLQTPGGVPYQGLFDAAWFLSIALTLVEIDSYISIRKAQGFTGATVMAVVNTGYNGGVFGPISAPANRAGVQPFTTSGDFSTYNPAYFDFIEAMVAKFAAANMGMLLYPAYWGYAGGNQGWFTEIGNNSQANCQAYGAYLGSRLKSYPNVIIGLGGDFRTSTGTTLTKYLALINSMRGQGGHSGKWVASSEWNHPDDLGTAQPGLTYGPDPATSDQQINSFYGYGNGPFNGNSADGHTFDTARAAWADTVPTSPIPVGVCEPPYSKESVLTGVDGTRENERKYHAWIALNGGFGFRQWGARYIWWLNTAGPDPLWSTEVFDDPSLDVCRLKSFLESFEWWKHAPSGTASGFAGRTLVVSGAGSGDSTIVSSIDVATGKSLAIYVPPTGTGTTTFGVDLRSMAGTSSALWINPTSGATSSAGSGFSNSLSNQSFTTPGNNGTGWNDWYLLITTP